MSAFVCNKETFVYVANVAWKLSGPVATKEQVVALVNEMFMENCRSVAYRYTEPVSDVVRESAYSMVFIDDISDVDEIVCKEAISELENIDYQSCEHPGWKDSKSHKAIEQLKQLCSTVIVKG